MLEALGGLLHELIKRVELEHLVAPPGGRHPLDEHHTRHVPAVVLGGFDAIATPSFAKASEWSRCTTSARESSSARTAADSMAMEAPMPAVAGTRPPQPKPYRVASAFGSRRRLQGFAVQALKSASDTLGSFLTKATMVQISWSGTSMRPKLGMPVMLMPFLITQNNWDGER